MIGSEDAYKSAKALLHERYGNCNVISSALINKLEEWPKIGGRNAEALRDLSDFLQKIKAAKETLSSLAVLDFAKEYIKILAKLPYNIQNKWGDSIKQCRATNGEDSYPPFSRFAKFIKECADKANIPELEELSKIKEEFKPTRKSTVRGTGANSFATTGSEMKKDPCDKEWKEEKDTEHCPYCDGNHSLNKCKRFAKNPYKDKKKFFLKKYLCLGCAADSHKIAYCKNKLKCDVCSRLHPTCLHQDVENKENVSNCTNVCMLPEQNGGVDHAMIIPVWVRRASELSKEILQVAVLDDQSNVSFVSQKLCDRLNVHGPSTELLLTTVQERNVRVQSSRICGLEVLDYQREQRVKLPMMFKRDVIPATRSQIPKSKVAVEWEHLRVIADKMPYNPDVEISLLIGNNCPRIVRPREIIVGEEDEPYGQRSLLGWGIIGRVCKSCEKKGENRDGVCSKIVVQETYSHFTFTTKVKEVINPHNILRVLESDFTESSTRNKSYSVEDERFLRILENGIRKQANGHYEMPLPLKSDRLSLPYNRQLAVKRWKQLLARFKKNPKFLLDYRAFMNDVIGLFAERVPPNRLDVRDGKINYVPHTGIYHPKKPGQIQVVFDCSAQYEGVSLNDHLLQGPDQINNLVGILCRFRQERVAFLTDIKSMFHQFMVSEEYRDLLRFLWWEDGDPENDAVEYRMKVHLFGAGSSPGCANFGLKKAADDGEKEFGEEASAFIRRDFYVDDGVKSVPTVDEAVTLIKASQGICEKAGLKLHKIMSNSKKVLEAIPVEERAKAVKDLDIRIDPLPMERTLGIMWCVENDSFQFRIELRDRPFTRRGILSTVGSIYDPNGYMAPVTLKGKQILQQMCRDKLDWDSPIPEDLRPQWEKW